VCKIYGECEKRERGEVQVVSERIAEYRETQEKPPKSNKRTRCRQKSRKSERK